jgi:hypothetical protein
MPETNTYQKLGQKAWRLTIGLDDGNEPYAKQVRQAEYPARGLGLARATAARWLRQLTNPGPRYEGGNPGHYWASIERGTYRDESFDDPADGRVGDASWEPDEDRNQTRIGYHAHLTDTGTVTWADPDFVTEDAR